MDVEWRLTKSVPPHGYAWQGPCTGVIENILPSASCLVPLEVLVCKAGWLVIDGIWLRWKSRSNPEWQGLVKVGEHSMLVCSRE